MADIEQELQTKALSIVNRLLDGIDKGIEVAPEVLHEYVTLFFIEALPVSSALAFPVFIITSFMFYKKAKGYERKHTYDDMHIGLYAGSIITAVAAGIISLHLICGVKRVIKIKMAPKAYLIERLRQ